MRRFGKGLRRGSASEFKGAQDTPNRKGSVSDEVTRRMRGVRSRDLSKDVSSASLSDASFHELDSALLTLHVRYELENLSSRDSGFAPTRTHSRGEQRMRQANSRGP